MSRANEQQGQTNSKGSEKELHSTVVVQPGTQHIAQNPNPRANENSKNTPFNTQEANKTGSEITDGEDA